MTRRITLGATALMALTSAFWLYWLWAFGRWAIPVALDEATWLDLEIVERHGAVTLGQQAIFGAMIATIILAGSATFATALRLLNLVRAGEYFTFRSTRAVAIFGWSLIVMSVWDTIYAFFFLSVLTWNNTDSAGVLADGTASPAQPFIAPHFFYDPGDISLALCGLGFALMGHVLTVARALEDETKAYV